jgi:lysophospholipase L1-like esterase
LVEVLLRLAGSAAPPPLEPRRFALVDAAGVVEPIPAIPIVDLGLPPDRTLRFLYDASGAPEHPYLITEGAWQHLDAPLNAHGLRGPLPAAEPGTRERIACIGDSFTFGDGVPEADAFVTLLGADEPGLELLNYGVPGFDITQVADQVEARVLADGPDRLVYAMTLNDAPTAGDAALAAQAAQAQADFQRSLDGPRGLARSSRLADLIQRRVRSARAGAEYHAVVRDSFAEDGPGWAGLVDELERLEGLARGAGAELTVVLFPLLVSLDGDYPFAAEHARIGAACRAAGIDFLDLLPAYRGQDSRSLWVHPTDQHPNPRGHALAAEAIAAHLGTGRD